MFGKKIFIMENLFLFLLLHRNAGLCELSQTLLYRASTNGLSACGLHKFDYLTANDLLMERF